MTVNVLDLALFAAAFLFAASGYRQGFVVAVLSFGGFVGGGVLGAKLAPVAAASGYTDGVPDSLLGLSFVFLLASVGQVLAAAWGHALRRRLTWSPAQRVDAAGGAVASVTSLLLVAWMVSLALASSAYPMLTSQIRRSLVIGTVDTAVPDAGARFFAGFRNLLDDSGFPEVFEGLQPTDDGNAEPPDPTLVQSAVVQDVRPSVLKVTGVAEECSKRVEGTGFVYAPDRVMTNAHVVAGVDAPKVEVDGELRDALVVLFDPGRDLAVLSVPGLGLPALQVSPAPARPGDDALVVGYPQDGPFRPDAARIIRTQVARGPDIYGSTSLDREIHALKGLVQPGNSGGPLLDDEGRVLGVIFAAAADDRTVGYAITWDEAKVQAERARSLSTGVDTQECS